MQSKSPPCQLGLLITQDGKDDNDKVKHIPRLLKVVLPQCEDLEDRLRGEDDDEAHVEVVQGEAPHLALVVVVKHHGEHVDTDEAHDDHVKLFVGHDPEDNGLGLPLK